MINLEKKKPEKQPEPYNPNKGAGWLEEGSFSAFGSIFDIVEKFVGTVFDIIEECLRNLWIGVFGNSDRSLAVFGTVSICLWLAFGAACVAVPLFTYGFGG